MDRRKKRMVIKGVSFFELYFNFYFLCEHFSKANVKVN